jgi:prepilin-type N-terminal cleavage/methylation domain-containing protein
LKVESGMTILELLTVLVIIAIIAAIGIPTFLDIKDKSIIGATEGNLLIIRKALNNYMADSPTNRYPVGPLDYQGLRSVIPFANLPTESDDAKIQVGSLFYTGDGITFNFTARSSNNYNQLFTVTPSGIVRN